MKKVRCRPRALISVHSGIAQLSSMIRCSHDISFEVVPIDDDGIKLKEETGPPFLSQFAIASWVHQSKGRR